MADSTNHMLDKQSRLFFCPGPTTMPLSWRSAYKQGLRRSLSRGTSTGLLANEQPSRDPETVADVLYIWLFAMLGVNALVVVLALAHATNERPDA
jgi:hypothetical protein